VASWLAELLNACLTEVNVVISARHLFWFCISVTVSQCFKVE